MARKAADKESWLLERQKSMVMRAAREGMSNLVLLAIDENPAVEAQRLAEPKSRQEVPLVTACREGHLDVVKNLVEKCKAPLNCTAELEIDGLTRSGVTPLWAATCSGNLELVRYLVQRGSKVNEHVSRNSSPLRCACFSGNLAIAKYLVENGADVNDVDFFGHSVLMAACYGRHKDTVVFLLDNGADVNFLASVVEDVEGAGETALHNCARVGDLEIAKELIARGAAINRSQQGETPLMTAAYKGHEDFVSFFVDTPDCSRDEKADALELLGSYFLEKGDTDRCLALWQRAMEERHRPGRPVAGKREAGEQVPAYGNAAEVQTLSELRKLLRSRDTQELQVQAMLIRERVLGKENKETSSIIEYFAAVNADENESNRAVALLFRILDNLSSVYPFHNKAVDVYAFLVSLLVEIGESDDEETQLSFSDTMTALKRSVSDFRRGEAELNKAEGKASYGQSHVSAGGDAELREFKRKREREKRENLLKIILHLIVLAYSSKDEATAREWRGVLDTVGSFVKTGVRGMNGSTLLHMAVDENTAEFADSWKAFVFPSLQAVQALLEAGCDVNAVNDAGRTALQCLRAEGKGEHSRIVDSLVAAGAR